MSLVYSDMKLSGGDNFRTIRFIKGQPSVSDSDDDDNTYLLISISFHLGSSIIIVNKEFIKLAKLEGNYPKTERSLGILRCLTLP